MWRFKTQHAYEVFHGIRSQTKLKFIICSHVHANRVQYRLEILSRKKKVIKVAMGGVTT